MKSITHALIASSLALTSMAGYAEENDIAAETSEAITAIEGERVNKFKPIVLPFYDPSIKAGIMALPLYAFYPDENDKISDASTIAAPIILTSNGSYVLEVSADLILMEDKVRIIGQGGYTSTNTNLLGIDTNKQSWSLESDVYYKLFENFYAGIGVVYENSRYVTDNKAQQPVLADAGFSDEFQDDKGIRIGFQWDTREQYYYPYSGFVWETKYESHNDWIGNPEDRTYASLFTDYRHFISINDDPNNIIATRLVGRYLFDAENAPSSAFTTYGRQGKEVQRGFEVGQYINANMLNFEAEYRHRLSNTGNTYLDKSTVVGIAGVGRSFGLNTYKSVDTSFSDSKTLGVVGVGYRYNILPYERINMKVDLTINSNGDVIAYFGVGESI